MGLSISLTSVLSLLSQLLVMLAAGSVSSSEPADCPGASSISGLLLAGAQQYFSAMQCSLDEPWPEHRDIPNNTEFEFIVVGGGTAGSVVAARLADLNYQVLLVEAGPDPPQDSIVPALHGTLLATKYDWNLVSVNEGPNGSSQALLGGSQALPRGHMLGGSGSLNDMVYSRGFPADYEEWASLVGNDWNWENVLPFFKKSENLTDERIINDPNLVKLHGKDGPIEVSGFNASTFETDQFLKAFHEIGFKLVKDMTNPNEIGAGRHSHTIRNGRRDSTVTAFLNKSAKKHNLSVLRDALVTKIKIQNMSAVGVEVRIGQAKFEFRASKEVIVSAGTYHTPKLLMLSGIGPEEHLREMGINVIKNLTGVGKNLQDHVMVLNFISADVGTCYTDPATGSMNIIKYFYDRSGPLSFINTMAAYKALDNSTEPNLPDFGFYPSCLPQGTPFYDSCIRLLRINESACTKLNDILKEKEIIIIAAVLMKPKSRGRVELMSSNPVRIPLIYARTFSNEDDLKGYPEALNVVKLLAESSYFREKNAKIVDLHIEQCKSFVGEEKVKCRAKAMAMSAWHCVGTAAMGSVVNATLVVNGVNNLRVVDASVMPTVVRGNTNAPVVMIAEKAVEFIKDRWK